MGLLLHVGEVRESTGQPAQKSTEIPQQIGTVRLDLTKRSALDVRQHPDQVAQSVPPVDPRNAAAVLRPADPRPLGPFESTGQVIQGGVLQFENAPLLSRAGDLEDENLTVVSGQAIVLITLARQCARFAGYSVQGTGEFGGFFGGEPGSFFGDSGQIGPAHG